MALNKSTGNMYEWVNATWNPINGTCEHDCEYCYVKRGRFGGWKHDVKIMNALKDKLDSKVRTIFVCTQTDLWGEWVDEKLINMVLKRCKDNPLNTYLFQSKNPGRFIDFIDQMPQNTILCTTIETNRDTDDVSEAPNPIERFNEMFKLKDKGFKISVTVEPIMDLDVDEMVMNMTKLQPDWISIGADSKNCGLKEPSKEKVLALIEGLQKGGVKIEQKKNLNRLLGIY